MDKKIILRLMFYVLLVLIGYVISFCFRFINLNPKSTNEITLESSSSTIKIPECYLGRCPEYFSMEVDGDGLSESVVIVPTRMTQGAGKVLVIDDGEVIFESEELANVGVKEVTAGNDSGTKFILTYSVVGTVGTIEELYTYHDGTFMLK